MEEGQEGKMKGENRKGGKWEEREVGSRDENPSLI